MDREGKPMNRRSRIHIIGDGELQEGGRCGYCGTEDGSISYYIRAEELSVDDYQLMADRGWRRSGTLIYKQHLSISCCPHYTIRLKASDFKPSRDQRQTLNRWRALVWGSEYTKLRAAQFPLSKEEKKKANNTFDLLGTVHEPEYEKAVEKCPKQKDGSSVTPEHKFEVTLEPSAFSEEKFELYKHYQMAVHKDEEEDVKPSSFTRFLCDSPLIPETRNGRKLGSYHQCYRLDGRLFAVAVLDFLPHCVSSVYFIYHTNFVKWGMGKLGALREIALALEEGYEYYYLGFYIHNCEKMKYKRDFGPSQLLDPETNIFVPFDSAFLEQFSKFNYVSMMKPERNCRPVGEPFVMPDLSKYNSFWEARMPGTLTEEEVEEAPFDMMMIQLDRRVAVACMLGSFDKDKFRSRQNFITYIFAVLESVLGVELSGKIIVVLK